MKAWHCQVVGLLNTVSFQTVSSSSRSRPGVSISRAYGSEELLVKLAVGKVTTCPFSDQSVTELKNQVVSHSEHAGLSMKMDLNDRQDVVNDYGFMGVLLQTTQDPEVGLRAGPNARRPRLPALYRPQKNAAQTDPFRLFGRRSR